MTEVREVTVILKGEKIVEIGNHLLDEDEIYDTLRHYRRNDEYYRRKNGSAEGSYRAATARMTLEIIDVDLES